MLLCFYIYHIRIYHCYWLPQSAVKLVFLWMLTHTSYIIYINNSQLLNTSCHCSDVMYYDCFKDELGAVYPGQTLIVPLYAHFNFTFNDNRNAKPDTHYILNCFSWKWHHSTCWQKLLKNEVHYCISYRQLVWTFLKSSTRYNHGVQYLLH